MKRDLLDQNHHTLCAKSVKIALHPIFHVLPWAEVAIALRVREQTLGLWVLSPAARRVFQSGSDRLPRARRRDISVGSEIIVLLDSAENPSREIITVQEEERRVFASQLHDQPLQRLAAVRMLLGQNSAQSGKRPMPLQCNNWMNPDRFWRIGVRNCAASMKMRFRVL